MRIMYLLFSFTVGGTERLVADICNEMSKRNNSVYLYVINDKYSEELLRSIDSKVHVILQKRSVGGGGKFKLIKTITKFIKNNKIEIIHCNSFNAPELLILKKFYFGSAKIYHTIHDVDQYKCLSKFRVSMRNNLCDKFIAISDSVHEDIVRYGADKDKVCTIYNAVNFERFESINNKSFNEQDEIIIGNVARLIPSKKGQDILIRAIGVLKAIYPNIICKFAGAPEKEEELKQLQRLAIELGVQENIVFLGNVNNVSEFLKELDIFVLPSRFEGFGISLIEAMATGVPCIASDIDGPREIINNVNCGVVFQPEKEDDLADKIKYMIENYRIEKELAIDNIKTVRELFDIRVMCDKLTAIYKQ